MLKLLLSLLLVGVCSNALAQDEPNVFNAKFSKTPIVGQGFDEKKNKFTTDFTTGDGIYIRLCTVDGKSIRSHQTLKKNTIYFRYKGKYVVDGGVDVDMTPATMEGPCADIQLLAGPHPVKQRVRINYDEDDEKEVSLSERTLSLIANNDDGSWKCSNVTSNGEKVDNKDWSFDMTNWGGHKFTFRCDAKTLPQAVAYIDAEINAALDTVKLPAAGMKDKSLTKKILTLVRKDWGNPKLISATIISDEWEVERNKFTGVILSRELQSVVTFQDSHDPALCYHEQVPIEQKYDGHKYGVMHVSGSMQQSTRTRILCKNVPGAPKAAKSKKS